MNAVASRAETPTMGFMEVPLIGSESVQWVEVTVPSSLPPSEPCAPPTTDAASFSIIENPLRYFIWRIHEKSSHTLELLELNGSSEFPKSGLRLVFRNALCPFAFICGKQGHGGVESAHLYVLTVSGVAYLIKLRTLSGYISGSVLDQEEVTEVNLRSHSPQIDKITSMTAKDRLLIFGQDDGSVVCFQLESAGKPGSVYELRDAGIGRLWGLVSRTKVSSAVCSLIGSVVHRKELLFVLHVDGSLRAWDLIGHTKIFHHTISLPQLNGFHPVQLYASDPDYENKATFLVLLYESASGRQIIVVQGLQMSLSDRLSLSPKFTTHISLEEGKLIDLNVGSKHLWVLKEETPKLFQLFHADLDLCNMSNYSLQEGYVSEQLLQSTEQSVDDFVCANYSIMSSGKGSSPPVASSVFLHRLLQPGIFHPGAVCATFQHYRNHITVSEIQNMSPAFLKKKILALIEAEENAENPVAVMYKWKRFYDAYFKSWAHNNKPYGLLVDVQKGVSGLIRSNSLSIFRPMEDVEMLLHGLVNGAGNSTSSNFNRPVVCCDNELLIEILRCAGQMNQRLDKAASSALYESLADPVNMSFDDVVTSIVKILSTGHEFSSPESYISFFGVDEIMAKKYEEHKRQRKFSAKILLSLHALCSKAGSWNKVLDVTENFIRSHFTSKRKSRQDTASKELFNIQTMLVVQSLSQVSRIILEASSDLLILLNFMLNIQGQLNLACEDTRRIGGLISVIQDILLQWFFTHKIVTSPTEAPIVEDFSYLLSSLRIDTKKENRWCDKLGTYIVPLGCLLFLKYPCTADEHGYITSRHFLAPTEIYTLMQNFSNWILSGNSTEEKSMLISCIIHLYNILLKHGQYGAAENLLLVVEAHLKRKRVSECIQNGNGEWSACLHLLGLCLLLRARCGECARESKVGEAVHCFFRAAAGVDDDQVLGHLTSLIGLPNGGSCSVAAWKLEYYQWVMQIFEQHNLLDSARKFAFAALEQVDEVHSEHNLESLSNIRGRLWANIFKFSLDLSLYTDAYCAIISNPDDNSKNICFRRFIFVLCDRCLNKVLCNGELPFVGLAEKVEQELVWKAEGSDITAKPNIYKLLYAIQMQRHNWRLAASYMHRYSVRLQEERISKDNPHLILALEERLNALTSAINALHLVHTSYAWISTNKKGYVNKNDQDSPNKKARVLLDNDAGMVHAPQKQDVACTVRFFDELQLNQQEYYVDINKLEEEYVLTSGEHLLALANVKYVFSGKDSDLNYMVDLLLEANLYDMAFTVVLKFWKHSCLGRELERVFVVLCQKCCLSRNDMHVDQLLLTMSEQVNHGSYDTEMDLQQQKIHAHWQQLEHYVEKYKKFHARLPVVVADTLLCSDPHVELPLWLIRMFKDGVNSACWGMTGSECDPATLLRLYIDYGRLKEATNLLLEYIEAFTLTRPSDAMNRKRMAAVWFPYTALDRLWFQLRELKASNLMVDQCDKLHRLLKGPLFKYLQQVQVDSEDTIAMGVENE